VIDVTSSFANPDNGEELEVNYSVLAEVGMGPSLEQQQ
jgi:hypothetical protein